MDIWSETPASVTPRPVIVPLGNVPNTPAIVSLDDGTAREPVADVEPNPEKRRPARRRREEVTDG